MFIYGLEKNYLYMMCISRKLVKFISITVETLHIWYASKNRVHKAEHLHN